MKKGESVVCKNCGTEFVWGKKRRLSDGQKRVLFVCWILELCVLFIAAGYSVYAFDIPRSFIFFFDGVSCVFGVLFIFLFLPISVLGCIKNGFSCPKCQCSGCVPSDTPVAKRLKVGK